MTRQSQKGTILVMRGAFSRTAGALGSNRPFQCQKHPWVVSTRTIIESEVYCYVFRPGTSDPPTILNQLNILGLFARNDVAYLKRKLSDVEASAS